MNKRTAKTLSLFDLTQMYPTEESAVEYFEQMRWGDSPVCVKCGCHGKITKQKNYKKGYWCGDCRSYFTAFTNTPLEHSRVRDVRKWLFASYLLMTARKGISSLQLSKELSVTQTTAWYMLHRLRLACGSNMEALQGEVEMDATYFGGKRINMSNAKRKVLKDTGRGTVGKQPMIGMRQRGGRTKAVVVETENSEVVLDLARDNVTEGSTVYSDEAPAYNVLGRNGYDHHKVNHSAKEYVNGMAHTNGIESVWAVIKCGYNGVYHNWSKKHCHRYVNEFSFRLNEGNVERDTQDRLDSLFQSMTGKTITYHKLTS